jgi:succinyl-diaminopimelate desuccinylase
MSGTGMTAAERRRIVQWVAEQVGGQRERLVELCADLVAAPSVNPEGDTRQVSAVVTRALIERGVDCWTEAIDPSMPSVLAEIDSGVPGPHLVLNVHLDTMPPGDVELWSVPVWELTRRDGKLYGLGMGNMKGAVAAMITAAGLLASLKERWAGRITFTAVSDEVVFGENGAAFLLRNRPDLLGDAMICGEGPGFERLAIGEKGVLWLRLEATGRPGHSSSVRRNESAAARIAAAVQRVDALIGTMAVPPQELTGMSATEPGFALSANVGTIRAGTFIGQVATSAVAEVDLRLPPGLPADRVEDDVRALLADIEGVTVTRIKGWDANWTSPADVLTQAWDRAAAIVQERPSTYTIRLPASDASRWRRRGVPALCYGPQPTFSAGVDDHAVEEEVLRCARLYTHAALEYLDPARLESRTRRIPPNGAYISSGPDIRRFHRPEDPQ